MRLLETFSGQRITYRIFVMNRRVFIDMGALGWHLRSKYCPSLSDTIVFFLT